MLASEAKKVCPDLVLVDGEDLTPFRDTSKKLFNFLRSHSWNNRVERLGFDEVFMGKHQSLVLPQFVSTATQLSSRRYRPGRLQPVLPQSGLAPPFVFPTL